MNTDIKALLSKIKENIKKVEDGDYSEALLETVCADFLELIELIKLFLISERDSYYGYFLMNMQFHANVTANTIAGIKLNEYPPVFESNPFLLCKLSLKEIIYVVCHELDHILLNHPAEMVKANPTGNPKIAYHFNLAADAAVNDSINHEIKEQKYKFMSQPDGAITSGSLEKMFHVTLQAKESYAYYFHIIRENKEEDEQNGEDGPQNGQESVMKQQGMGEKGEGSQGSELEDGGSQDGEGADEAQAADESADQVVTAKNCKGLKDHDWEAGNDAEEAAEAVKQFVNAATEMMSSESRGLMPGNFLSQVAKINEPAELSWQAILKRYVGTITANKRKTRMRLNRRQPERFDLSGRMDDKTLKIVVAIDTSGSVGDEMISRIFNEIFEILAKRKHDITVIECDDKVQRVYKARNAREIKEKVAGRGGTSFSPAIEYINNDRYFRDALLIYFTDGFGEYKIPQPRTYRNMWVVFGDTKNLSVQEPYGVVLSLKK